MGVDGKHYCWKLEIMYLKVLKIRGKQSKKKKETIKQVIVTIK